jgi:hypothetical protein
MSSDPWTDPDPQPGDFDADLANLDPRYVGAHDGDPEARLLVAVGIAGEDAERLERLAEARGISVADVVSKLLRDAEQSRA